MEKMLTVEQAGAYLNVNRETVRIWLRTGRLRGVKMGYRTWRVPEAALLELNDSSRNAPDWAIEADHIISELRNPDGNRHNAAIIALASASTEVRAVVAAASAQAASDYYNSDKGRMELADWNSIQGEPFEDAETDSN